MKKGELRREAIIRTAERLFFEKGYEETSIQDILDELSISKGGFYHHFDTKIALLGEICRQRCERDLERVREEIGAGKLNPIQKLNLLLGTLHLFERSEPDFAALVLKVSYLDGDVHFREQMRAFMFEALRPLMDAVIAEGMEDGSFFTRHPGTLGELLLLLGCDINDEVCRMLAANPENPECVIGIMELLDAYREGAEMLSGAPFGKISLFEVEHLMEAFRQTAEQLILLKARS